MVDDKIEAEVKEAANFVQPIVSAAQLIRARTKATFTDFRWTGDIGIYQKIATYSRGGIDRVDQQNRGFIF